jgi:pSer/pThr/pTyr-binding forkhead associated (FHA) protein
MSDAVVGRGVSVDIQLDDDSVSRRHAQLRIVDGNLTIEDLESRNGTRVNDRMIATPAPLSVGDRVCLGDSEFELVTIPALKPERVTQPTTTFSRAEIPAGANSLTVLSPRERTVFPLLARGLSQREIAAQCSVSVKTVETYRTRISHKLGLHSRADLIRFALETGVLRPMARN